MNLDPFGSLRRHELVVNEVLGVLATRHLVVVAGVDDGLEDRSRGHFGESDTFDDVELKKEGVVIIVRRKPSRASSKAAVASVRGRPTLGRLTLPRTHLRVL